MAWQQQQLQNKTATRGGERRGEGKSSPALAFWGFLRSGEMLDPRWGRQRKVLGADTWGVPEPEKGPRP